MCVRELGPDKYLSKPQKCDEKQIRKYQEIISETKDQNEIQRATRSSVLNAMENAMETRRYEA